MVGYYSTVLGAGSEEENDGRELRSPEMKSRSGTRRGGRDR